MAATINLYETIGTGDSTAAAVSKVLKAAGANTPIEMHINSGGGDGNQGIAIYDMLARHAGPITAYIDGLAASAASFIAMVAHDIIMPENAMMMVHCPLGTAEGQAKDLRRAAEVVQRLSDWMASAYAKRTKQPLSAIEALMEAETWMSAAEAVRLGFADRIEQPVEVVASVDLSSFGYRHPPTDIGAYARAYWAKRGQVLPEVATDAPEPPMTFGGIDHDKVWTAWNAPKTGVRS